MLKNDIYSYYLNLFWKNKKIPPNKSNISQFIIVSDKVQKRLNKIICKDKNLLFVYKQYINKDCNIENNINYIRDIISIIDNMNSLNDVYNYLYDKSINPLIYYNVLDNPFIFIKKPYILEIGISSLSLPTRDHYLSKKYTDTLNKYHEYQTNLIKQFDISNIDLNIVREIEHNIALKIYDKVDERNLDKIMNYIKIDELKDRLSNILFLKKDQYILIHYNPNNEYFKIYEYINELFGRYNYTINYFKWIILNTFASIQILTEPINKLYFDFYNNYLLGQKEKENDDYLATQLVTRLYSNYISEIYKKKYVSQSIIEDVNSKIILVKKVFKVIIKKNKWMTDETKKKALLKLSHMKSIVGYSSIYLDYSKLFIELSDILIENIIASDQFHTKINMSKLKLKHKIENFVNSYETNAYYSPLINTIIIPAGILLYPFYWSNNINNFGSICTIIGHEMSHGFDDQGCKFDKDGKYNNWWVKEDFDRYNNLLSKLIKQYDMITVPEVNMKLNGKLTVGENIADLYGIILALLAMKLFLYNNKIKLTNRILKTFFISNIIMWLKKVSKEKLIMQIMTDPHAPAKYRINQIFSNIDDFYKAFNISYNDDMYLLSKDRIKLF